MAYESGAGIVARLPRAERDTMKITDVSLTLFAWDSIPATIYGHHTARPTGKSDLGLLAVETDEGVTGHAFLGTSSNPASLDGPGLIRFLKPLLMEQNSEMSGSGMGQEGHVHTVVTYSDYRAVTPHR